ncbi:MAG: phosphopantetheine-binding protein [Planctomycetota bacterium]
MAAARSHESIALAITTFINAEIMAAGHEIGPDASLEDAGVDSMALLKVLLFIETEYGFWIPDEDLTPEVIQDANHLATYIESKLASA